MTTTHALTPNKLDLPKLQTTTTRFHIFVVLLVFLLAKSDAGIEGEDENEDDDEDEALPARFTNPVPAIERMQARGLAAGRWPGLRRFQCVVGAPRGKQ
jgi:hypothetical protein